MARGYKNISFKWNGSASVVIENLGFTKELQRDAADILYKYSFEYMPYKSGDLALNSDIRIHGGKKPTAYITHFVNYAQYQYRREDYIHSPLVHPQATDHWYDWGWLMHKKQITKEVDEARLKYRSFNYGK